MYLHYIYISIYELIHIFITLQVWDIQYARQAMGPQREKMMGMSFDNAGTPAPGQLPPDENTKATKVKPMSKRLSSSISACSNKLTDVLAWQAKLKENKGGLILA